MSTSRGTGRKEMLISSYPPGDCDTVTLSPVPPCQAGPWHGNRRMLTEGLTVATFQTTRNINKLKRHTNTNIRPLNNKYFSRTWKNTIPFTCLLTLTLIPSIHKKCINFLQDYWCKIKNISAIN